MTSDELGDEWFKAGGKVQNVRLTGKELATEARRSSPRLRPDREDNRSKKLI